MNSWTISQRLIFCFAYVLCRSLHASYRYRWHGLPNYEAAAARSERQNPAIAVWHQNTLPALLSHAHRKLAIIVSQSFDGEVIASVAQRFGILGARGSSHRGGKEALRAALAFAREGRELGITVDGPTGPRHEVKPGIFSIAARTGTAVLPLAAVGRKRWILHKTWDRFHIPKPFSIIDCVYGEPIFVPRELDETTLQELQAELKRRLLALETEIASWTPN
jgi:lysophospholipid acyltransferase (LPLAT)-like uncharacterized protein